VAHVQLHGVVADVEHLREKLNWFAPGAATGKSSPTI
jgi:hypothetical protein